MSNLCPFVKYKDIFGQAGKGVHSIRFINVAIVDYILTIKKLIKNLSKYNW